MMRNRYGLIVIVTLLLGTTGVSAQSPGHTWDIKGKIGVGIPLADLSDTHDAGFAALLGLTRWFGPSWGLTVSGAGEFLGGKDGIPAANLWHYNIGPEFNLINPETGKFFMHGNVGVGGTTVQFDGGGEETNFTVNAGVNLEYAINSYFRIIGGPDFYAIFDDEMQYVLPLTAGFRYLFRE